MSVVHGIIKALGGHVATAEKTGLPQQTVSSWTAREPAEIPPWHRPNVLEAFRREQLEIPHDALVYLSSRVRTPRAKQAA